MKSWIVRVEYRLFGDSFSRHVTYTVECGTAYEAEVIVKNQLWPRDYAHFADYTNSPPISDCVTLRLHTTEEISP